MNMRGLYPIIDLDTLLGRGLDVVSFARAVIASRPPLIQLRAKQASPRDTLALLGRLRPMCREAGVLLFANDRADLALIAGCDGVHVGQEDLEVDDVRRIAPSLALGVSTHTLEQLEAALDKRPSYVAFGPVFATASKAAPDPVVGMDGLEAASRRARVAGVELVAIGGITLERAPSVARSADLGAAIGALLPEPGLPIGSVTERALSLHRALGGSA